MRVYKWRNIMCGFLQAVILGVVLAEAAFAASPIPKGPATQTDHTGIIVSASYSGGSLIGG
jgi:hypothetical protein